MRRKAKQVNTRICTEDSSGHGCIVAGSVRGMCATLTIDGRDEWAHLSLGEAIRLLRFLDKAIREIGNRRVADSADIAEYLATESEKQ